jgi:transposase-like protein
VAPRDILPIFKGVKMSKKNRRVHDEAFKVKVVLESLKEEKTLAELSSQYEIHANQIGQWRKQFLQNVTQVFSGNKSEQEQIQKLESEKEDLHRQIGEQAMDIAYLKKSLKKLGLM